MYPFTTSHYTNQQYRSILLVNGTAKKWQTHAESYTAIADIVFDTGWSKSLFVNERKVKRDTATVSHYVAVWLWDHFRVHRQDQQQSGGEKWHHSHSTLEEMREKNKINKQKNK